MPAQIRVATTADAAAIHEIYAPVVENTVISFELTPPSVEEIAGRIAKTVQRHPWLACCDGDELLGYAYASEHRSRLGYQWSTDVSVYVHPNRRRGRVGLALYTALLAILRAQDYYAAFAGITQPNIPSVRLHESLGFAPLGVYRAVGYKLGGWHDVGWWQCDLRPREHEPSAPTPFPAVADSAPVRAMLVDAAALLRISPELTGM